MQNSMGARASVWFMLHWMVTCSAVSMGGKKSKPEVEPPLLDKEWQAVPWNAKAEYLQSVSCFEPFKPRNDEKNEDQRVRILLHGPTGHGRSSFINTVETVLRSKTTDRALVDSCGGRSFTKKYTTYKITKEEDGTFYPFVFNDIMGLEKDEGVCEEDIKLAMMGHVKDGYTFSPHSTLSRDDPYYNTNPSLNDKVHVLVCVVCADKVHLLDEDVMKKMRKVRLDASDMGIPQMAILTKIDEACPEVDADLRNVYKSKYVKKQNWDPKPLLVMIWLRGLRSMQNSMGARASVWFMLHWMVTCSAVSMGGFFSKPEVEPPSPPLLDKEWRPVPWNAKGEYLQFVRGFEPFQPHNDERNEDQHIRILLLGPVCHGKSSFINSVNSILQDRVTGRTLAVASGTTFTTKYTTYKITKGARGTFYPFVFNDIMGLEKNEGVREDDIKLAMMGHVKDGYTFNPHSTLPTDDPHYNTNPSLSDKVHVLVCVVSADKINLMDDDAVKRMRTVRLAASDMGIPQMAILTNIDVACPEVKANLRNVYKSKYVKEKMELLSESLGIPLNCIFPVKNYHSEIAPNDDLEMLILMALKQMLNQGEDFVNDCKCT
ncbi:uncharacterized protein LOC115423642 [Sphaeramia orbicularis]|uniref:uncharacterized protein LOC115423642 n=1 Tax=Sphaeramia orbicularis TaxID=375764 RepID=UPI00117EC157|nr:uncharacterized protein LOC115423642 [Sphaeramia orbicularis]